ncbi:MAG: hypothetical protein JW769_00155 [Parachlamydiales bacterium]|nr:hypothetical protein [Parachlamydiales bacterium]
MIQQPVAYILKTFLSDLPPETQTHLLSYCSEAEKNLINHQMPPTFTIDPQKYFQDGLIFSIHYSWLIPFLKTQPPESGALFLSLFPPQEQKKLSGLLQVIPSSSLSNLGKKYCEQFLLSYFVKEQQILPIEFLPSSPLNFLLSLSKEQLISLIDYLSLYDLVEEMRYIVDRGLLKRIFHCLPDKMKQLIPTIPKQSFSLPRMNLPKWDGSKKTFLSLLHTRGLQRLGIALIGQHPHFIWYLTHKLDIGRGNAVIKYSLKEISPIIIKIIITNIEEIVNLVIKGKMNEAL